MLHGPVAQQYGHPPNDQRQQQALARRTATLGCPLPQYVMRPAFQADPDHVVTLDYDQTGLVSVSARVEEPITLHIHSAITRLNAVAPGLAAWVLQEVHEAFRLTHPFTTPQWAQALTAELVNQTPLGRRNAFRARHPEHRRARTRFTEMQIAREGYPTSARTLLILGHWLCTSPWLPGDAHPLALLRASGDEHATLADVLHEARATPLPPDVTPHRAPYPAVQLSYGPDPDEDRTDLISDLLEHLTGVWRSHDGSYAWVTTAFPARARAFVRVVTQHQALAQEVRTLLG